MLPAREKKAQVALEFMLLAAFFMLVLLVVIAYFSSMQTSEMADREYLLGQQVAGRIADEVHTALLAGQGYQKTIMLPPTIAGAPYELRITNSMQYATAYVEISWTRGTTNLDYSFPLETRNVYAERGMSGFPINDANPLTIDVTKPLTIMDTDFDFHRVGNIVFHQD
ncbi:Uncharacterised protein [Candidatus Burarchaeum australiense]|nr:Uncharacterised protein [Candidatus Burarchaeum australiense]